MTVLLAGRPDTQSSIRISALRVLAAALGATLLAESAAHSAEYGITGKKLQLKSPSSLQLLSKDIAVSLPDPSTGADSSVSFDDGSGAVTFALPAANWKANSSGTSFSYKNADAPDGPSVVKVAKLKSGLLKVVAKGLPFAVPNGSASIDVVVSLNDGATTFCMTFEGSGDGSKFLVKDAPAGTCPYRARRAFRTSTNYNGNLVQAANNLPGDNVASYNCSADAYTVGSNFVSNPGVSGVDAADCLCRERAAAANLECPSGNFGCWKAWIADTQAASQPASRFAMALASSELPIVQVDATGAADPAAPIAVGGWADLITCGEAAPDPENGTAGICLDDASINPSGWRNESGTRAAGTVWNNVTNSGALYSASTHCLDWSYAVFPELGMVGGAATRGTGWTSSSFSECDNVYGLYCFEDY